MYVLVSGSRDWGKSVARANLLYDVMYRLRTISRTGFVTVLHGAASRKSKGVEVSADMMADRSAHENGYQTKRFPADWSQGRGAGLARNQEMMQRLDAYREAGHQVLFVAFRCNKSRGTQDAINRARAHEFPSIIFDLED